MLQRWRTLANLARRLGLALCLAAGGASCPAPAAETQRVVYPADDFRFAQYLALLRASLEKTVTDFGPFEMSAAGVPMNEVRYFQEARAGQLVNVVWGATSVEREEQLLPIRIPLEKGLLGYRLLLTPASVAPQLAGVQTAHDLAGRFKFCLGRGWGDVPIYLHAGFDVELADYDSLFKMVETGRCDLLSRGINEVFDEWEHFAPSLPHVVLEPRLLLHYRYAYYFFVSPTDRTLARRIETGLRRMIDDGSFDEIFNRYYKSAIDRANIKGRRVIELANPELPPQTPLSDSRLWYVPSDDAKRRKPR
jgi:hypothetical protein